MHLALVAIFEVLIIMELVCALDAKVGFARNAISESAYSWSVELVKSMSLN
jgi:hypothetical protein